MQHMHHLQYMSHMPHTHRAYALSSVDIGAQIRTVSSACVRWLKMGPFKALPASSASSSKDPPASCQKRKRVERRSIDEQVNLLVQKHLKNVSETALTQHIIDGVSLIDRIRRDKDNAMKTGKYMSTFYWRQLKLDYGIPEHGVELKVKRPDEQCDADLVAALQVARNPNASKRSKAGLLAWLSSVAAINQKTLVGLLKHILSVKPANAPAAQLVLAFMKTCVRLRLHDTYPEETPWARKTCSCADLALVSYLAAPLLYG